jgi:predicted SnoaL-like aldol condensation-catalyzing enzyme
MDVGVRNSQQLTVTSPQVIDFIASPRSCRSQCGGHGAEPAHLGDTPDGHRVDAFSVDDVDGGGGRVTSRDLASFAARGLLDSRHAYSVAYLVRDRQQISITKRKIAMTNTAEQNKALVLEAFETLFNRRDYAAALRFWSPDYIQHSAHIEAGRDGLFDLVKNAPADMHYENALIIANGDYVMAHGRLSNTGLAASWIAVDIVRLQDGVFAEHWDVLQFEATAEESKSGLPMFGDSFPTRA